ncbi:MAG: pilus assembly protein PilM [Rubrivivax sp.]
MGFLRWGLRARTAPLIGLDVSPSSLKLVELGRDASGRFVLERLATEPLGGGWLVDGQVERFDEVVDALRRLVSSSGTKTRRVAMALPQGAVITRKVIVPAELRDDEMLIQIEGEVSSYVPFPIDEVSLDFCVIGPRGTSVDELEVLVAVCRKDRVQDLQALAEAAGLVPGVLDIDSYASRMAVSQWAACLPQKGQDPVIALFEIGGESTGLKVLSNDALLHDRDHAFGGGDLTRLIARQYNLGFDEAERRKLDGALPPSYLAEVHEPFVDNVAREVGRALQYFFTSSSHHKVDMILLAGGTATQAGLAARVSDVTGFDCQVVNPFERMVLGGTASPRLLEQSAPAYLTACGLAMRRFYP